VEIVASVVGVVGVGIRSSALMIGGADRDGIGGSGVVDLAGRLQPLCSRSYSSGFSFLQSVIVSCA